MKFIADAMLGKLAKWLRFLGFDVLYNPHMDDRQIIRLSMLEGRKILTRDTNLMGRKGIERPVFVKSDAVTEQLSQIMETLDFRDADPVGRCVACNGRLFTVSPKSEVRDSVPDYVYHNTEHFLECKECGKVYWRGSHYDRFMEKVRSVVKEKLED